jgi:predicted PhzF superfamily epimerase YddE/YHI9
MSAPLHLVDVFVSGPFSGNPAAVVLLSAAARAEWMQDVAAELGRPATAFLTDDDRLRWFSPSAELEICGHGTLAAAAVRWRTGAEGVLAFDTAAGRLEALPDGDGAGRIAFPLDVPAEVPVPDGLAAALGAEVVRAARSSTDLIAELASPEAVETLAPDGSAVATFDVRGVIVTAAGGREGADVTSRFFAPRRGIPEDPATGSAHAVLGPYWAPRLGKQRLACRQASARGGRLTVEVEPARTLVGGRVAAVADGTLVI